MSLNVYKANIITSKNYDELNVFKNAYLAERDGIVEYVGSDLPDEYKEEKLTDYGNMIMIPAFSDLHIHASQYVERGVGMDSLLFDWLNNYTFPQEAGFRDIGYARKIYPQLIRDLLRQGTMHAAFFTTIHYDSCDLFFRMLGESGMYAYSGKINMDQNSPDYYVEETERSIEDTERFIAEHLDLYPHVKPIVIPRFAPTCSEKLLKGLGRIVEEYDVGLHTHLVESRAEAAFAKECYPQYLSDGDIYEQTGLMAGSGPKIFAHVIFPGEVEERLLRKYDAVSVHCPDSTTNITAGIMPVSDLRAKDLKIALGSDIGGGHFAGIYRQIARSVQLSKMKEFYEEDYKRITFKNAFYLATAAGGEVFGRTGKLEKGYAFNALVIDDMQDEGYTVETEEALERFCYAGDDRNIKARYLDGRLIDPDEIYERIKKL
ncbi:MAG: amidohydrolase family protein [Erysipelotrichaceae bacterium]|nr:amidohydrolase family protein [Erysipelotrichaceae bacterium]